MESQITEFPVVSNVSSNIDVAQNEETLKNVYSAKTLSHRDILLDKLDIISATSDSQKSAADLKVRQDILSFDSTLRSFVDVHLPGWKLISDISSKLIDFDEQSVVLECLIDRENQIYEEKEFDISLFDGYALELGKLFKISMYKRLNQMMIDVKDDPKLVLEKDFPILDLYNKYKNIKLTNDD